MKKLFYSTIQVLLGYGSPLYYIINFDHMAGGSLPGTFTWNDRYFIWCDYVNRRSERENVTLQEVQVEQFNTWSKEFEQAKKEIKL